jgi:CheY-like chemotaxis protein
MGQVQQKRRAVLVVEDDADLRHLMAALFEDEQMDTIECESAEAALATLLIGGRKVAMIFADVRLRGVMDGIDLAREVKMRWPFLPVILTSGHPREHVGKLPPGVAYLPKPWQPLNVLIAAEQALSICVSPCPQDRMAKDCIFPHQIRQRARTPVDVKHEMNSAKQRSVAWCSLSLSRSRRDRSWLGAAFHRGG